MKPLDLSVSIQNSYEAARSEAVRLDKPHVVGRLANEDAQREQVVRDQSVVSVEPKLTSEDMFAADEYEHSDYTEQGTRGFKRRDKKKNDSAAEAAAASEEAGEKTVAEKQPDEEAGNGFSTYA